MRRLICLLGFIGQMGLGNQVSATPPMRLAEILPVQPSTGVIVDLPDIAVRVNHQTVARMTIESVITSAAGDIVNVASAIDVIVMPDLATARIFQSGGEASMEAGPILAVAQPSDVLTFDSPHLLGLQEGPHVQTIKLSIALPGRPSPLQSRAYRLMDVRTDGIHSLTMQEFDELVSVKELAPRPDGTLGLARKGRLGPAVPVPNRQDAADVVVLEAGAEATGDVRQVQTSEVAQ